MKKPAKPAPEPLPVAATTLVSVTALTTNPTLRAELRDRVAALERRHRNVHLCVLIAFDVVPCTFGATLHLRPGFRKYTMQFYGAETWQKLLDSVQRWCTEQMLGWLTGSDKHDAQLKAHPQTVADVVRDAAPLWYAAGKLVGDCDNSIGRSAPPKSVGAWLAKNGLQPVSREAVAGIYRAHLDASTRWARLIEPSRDRAGDEKVS